MRDNRNTDKHDVTIDLIGAVHIGEKAYYDKLNKEFEQYDVLLYELVAPEGKIARSQGGWRRQWASVRFCKTA